MSDFSLVGYENVNIQEFLPILNKIKYDLNYIFENGVSSIETSLDTLQFKTNLSDKSQLKYESKSTCTDFPTAQPESGDQVSLIQKGSCNESIVICDNKNIIESDTLISNLRIEIENLRSQLDQKDESMKILSDQLKSENDMSKELIEDRNKTIKVKEDLIFSLHDEIKIETKRNKEEMKVKDAAIENLAEQLKREKKVIEDRNKTIEEKDQLISEMEIERKQEQEEMEVKKAAIENLTDQLQRLEGDQSKEEKEQLIEDKTKIITQCQKDIRELKETIKTNSKEHDTNTKAKDAQIKSLESQIEELGLKLKTATEEIAAKVKSIKKLETKVEDFESLKGDIDAKNEIIVQLENEIKEITELKEEKCNTIISLKEKVKKMESDENESYQVLQKKLKSKRNELRKKDSICSTLEESYEELKVQVNVMEKEKKTLTKEFNKLKTEHSECETNIENYEQQLKIQGKKIKELERKVEDTDETHMKEIESMKLAMNAKAKEKDKILSDYNNCKREMEIVGNKLKQCESDNEKKNKGNKELQNKCETLEKKCKEHEETIKKKQSAMDTMKTKIKDIQNVNPAECNECKVVKRELLVKIADFEQMEQKVHNYVLNLEQKYQETEMLKKDNMKVKEELENIKKLNFNERTDGGANPATIRQPQHQEPGLFNRILGGRQKNDKTPYPNWWKDHMN